MEMSVSRIELSLSPALYEWRTIKSHHTTVAVDVLRATTAICAAFQSGVKEVVPLDSLEPLSEFHKNGYLRAAERGGRKIGEAECGNSPTEYLTMDLRGQRIAYSTTNGTISILHGGDADRTLVGCFANIDRLTEELTDHPQDLVILCSGWVNDVSIEDTLFAGALCDRLIASGKYESTHDAVHMAIELWHNCKKNPYNYCLEHASHVQRLKGFGAERDIEFSFRMNTCPVLPILNNGVLTLI